MEGPDRLAEVARLVKEPVSAAVVIAWAALGVLVAPFLMRNRTRLRFGLKVAASIAAVGGATAILVDTTDKSALYYKHVAEVVERPETVRDKSLLVLGCVVAGSLERARGGSPRYRFKLRDLDRNSARPIPVTAGGEVPAHLRENREVVVKARLTRENTLEVLPDGVMTKCPGKYASGGFAASTCPY